MWVGSGWVNGMVEAASDMPDGPPQVRYEINRRGEGDSLQPARLLRSRCRAVLTAAAECRQAGPEIRKRILRRVWHESNEGPPFNEPCRPIAGRRHREACMQSHLFPT